MATFTAKAFKSGNSVAVRLPKAAGVTPGDVFRIEQTGGELRLVRDDDPAAWRAKWKRLAEELLAIGPSPDGVQEREPIEFPERPGL